MVICVFLQSIMLLLQINPFYDETQASHPDISRHAFGINSL